MSQDRKKIIKTLSPKKVWVPVLFTIAFLVYKFYSDDKFTLESIGLISEANFFPLVFAAIMLVIRELAYIYRIRFLSDEQLSLTASTYIILLWEFASAVTPSVVGGTPVAVFLMMKEGINLGKSLAYAMITAIFDNLYLVILSPLFYLLYYEDISNLNLGAGGITTIKAVFVVSYGLILFYTFIMAFSIFLHPRWFKWIMIKLTSLKWTKRWRYSAYQHGTEVMLASEELRGKSRQYWWRISYTTFISWTSRFLLLNIMILAFIDVSITDHILVFGKQVVLWVFMLASPTPGSSGTAEIGFEHIFDVLLGSYTTINVLLWRLFTYFSFLIVGVLLLPRWIKRVFVPKKKTHEEPKPEESIDFQGHS